MNIIADVKRQSHGKRFCVLSFGSAALGKTVASKYGFFFFSVNIEQKEDCLLMLKQLCHLCYEEQSRTNFLKRKDTSNSNGKRGRESRYCWWSFC